MPLQFLIAMWGAWIGLGIIVASEALGTSCLGAGERGHYGSGGGYQYGYARQVPSCISRGTSLNGISPLSGR
jgi:hypothetical protein